MMIAAGSILLPDVTSPATQHLLDTLDDSNDAVRVALGHPRDALDSSDADSVALDTSHIYGFFIESYSNQSSVNAPSYSHPQCDGKSDLIGTPFLRYKNVVDDTLEPQPAKMARLGSSDQMNMKMYVSLIRMCLCLFIHNTKYILYESYFI